MMPDMKQLIYTFYTCCLLVVSLWGGEIAFLNEQEQAYLAKKPYLKVYLTPDIYYYSYTYENYLNGYGVQYFRMLAKKLGVELQFLTYPSIKDAKNALEKGDLDVALFPHFEAVDKDRFLISDFPVGIVRPALLMPKIYQLSPKIESMESLRIVVLKDEGFEPLIHKTNPNAKVETVESLEEVVAKVMSREADIAIGLHEVFMAYIEYKMIATLQSIPLQNSMYFPPNKLFLATAKENTQMKDIINKTMAQIDYRQLIFARDRFFPPDTYRQTNIKVALTEEEKFYLMGKQALNICTVPNGLPYGDSINHHYEGIGASIVELLTKYLDIPLHLIHSKNTDASYESLFNKTCDLVVLATPTLHPNESISFTKELLSVPLVVVTKDDVLYVSNFQDIAKKSFVIARNHPMLKDLLEKYPSLHLKEVDSDIEGLKEIEKGKSYGLITSLYSVSNLFRSHIPSNLKVSAEISLHMPFSFALLSENKHLQTILEKTSESILRPELPHITKKWLKEHYPRSFDAVVILELVLFFIIFFAVTVWLYLEIKLKNRRLEDTKNSLDTLNKELESRVKYEVEISREKDMVMYRQSRFASMGEMISNIAHQWRQPLMELAALLMELQASMHFKTNVSKKEVTDTITSSNRVIAFMSQTIDDFRHFFSPSKDLSLFCINEVVEESVRIIRATLAHHLIEVEVITHTPKAMACGLKNEYAQVLINLLSNAKDMLLIRKIPEGKICIEIKEDEVFSIVLVMDNAGGVASENIAHIFEPFFTKEKANGTGIGLFMSRMIIEKNMQGQMSVENIGAGALFCIKVPKPKKAF